MISTHTSCDHNAYHRRFRDTWSQRAKEVTRPFAFQAKAPEMAKNQYKSELLIRSHPRGRGFESHQVHHKIHRNSDRITVDLSVASFRRACGNRRIHGAEMEIAAPASWCRSPQPGKYRRILLLPSAKPPEAVRHRAHRLRRLFLCKPYSAAFRLLSHIQLRTSGRSTPLSRIN